MGDSERLAADGRPVGDRAKNGGNQARGLPGKLTKARNTAPDGASDELAQAVAFRAYNEDRDVAELWAELWDDGE